MTDNPHSFLPTLISNSTSTLIKKRRRKKKKKKKKKKKFLGEGERSRRRRRLKRVMTKEKTANNSKFKRTITHVSNSMLIQTFALNSAHGKFDVLKLGLRRRERRQRRR